MQAALGSSRTGGIIPPGKNSMSALCFVDTQLLVYSRDASEPDKQPRALFTEDPQDDQDFDGTRIVDPFSHQPGDLPIARR